MVLIVNASKSAVGLVHVPNSGCETPMNLVCDISFIDGSAVDSRNLDVFLP